MTKTHVAMGIFSAVKALSRDLDPAINPGN